MSSDCMSSPFFLDQGGVEESAQETSAGSDEAAAAAPTTVKITGAVEMKGIVGSDGRCGPTYGPHVVVVIDFIIVYASDTCLD